LRSAGVADEGKNEGVVAGGDEGVVDVAAKDSLYWDDVVKVCLLRVYLCASCTIFCIANFLATSFKRTLIASILTLTMLES